MISSTACRPVDSPPAGHDRMRESAPLSTL
ncbi:Uncharacterised protein [Bordetella pertussis]|nr:Uncharacterised protein [Bordetella pertussis]